MTEPGESDEPVIPNLIGDDSDLETAWLYYTWMEATQWQHLPHAGALADQDEALMINIFAIAGTVNKLRSPTR